MDRWQAQFDFWSSFGIPAYQEDSVPDRKDLTYPYITYEAVTGCFESVIPVSASIWSRAESWTEADNLSDEIEQYIKRMGCPVIDGGRYRVIIPNGRFSHSMGDPEDDQIKRKLLNVEFEFMTI